jgi:hypothetical protein
MSLGRVRQRALASLALSFAIALPGTFVNAATPEPSCPLLSPEPGAGETRLHEGMLLEQSSVLRLQQLLPIEVWRLRGSFFHEGMALEVGPCHRHYPLAGAFEAATLDGAGMARLDDAGNLSYDAPGLPFAPEQIDINSPDAGLQWAWNLERRHRGPGVRGRFRLVDMPSRLGGIQIYEGEWSFLQTARRADLTDAPAKKGAAYSWVAGGRFLSPNAARHLAWHQLRPIDADLDSSLPDRTFVYVPSMRKVRRAASSWVDGFYTPRYRASAPAGGGANPTSGNSIQVTENLRRGFEGLALRPNAYRWRVLGERDVLAPINVTRMGYPTEHRRNFGPAGLSVGDDRWDVRSVVVIQGALRTTPRDYDFLTVYVDRQTQQPLYMVTHRKGSRLVDVGILVYRYTGDRSPGPLHADGSPVNAFEPVAALFHDTREGGSGWRRESYDLRMTPPSPKEIEALMSQQQLSTGH